jgi:16S rRNA (guanine527-N7)-methyltransferase
VTATVPMGELDRVDLESAGQAAFSTRFTVAARYADFLASAGIERGMIGPREAGRIWERHLLNSAALCPLIPEGSRVVDLGSGAGLPGIPIAIARPDLEVVLLEPMQRRTRFLADCLEVLGLANVEVVRGRAESGVGRPADIVVARAVAELSALVRLAAGLLRRDGVLLALKGASAAVELAALQEAGTPAELLTLPAPGSPATVVRVRREEIRGSAR